MFGKNKTSSTQQYLSISSIEQDVVILRNGAMRALLLAHPINFDLKSDTEQNAIIYGYQAFLNSLKFPVQIVVRSRRLDLERYLVKLGSQTKNITNNLLQIQAQDYIDFVRRLIQIANIMSKQFYVVVGYQRTVSSNNPLSSIIPGSNKGVGLISEADFKTYHEEIINRVNMVAAGLNQIGVKTEMLATQQLIELFYGIYNPEESMTERLAPIDEMEADIITTGENKPDAVSPTTQNTNIPAPASDGSTPINNSPNLSQSISNLSGSNPPPKP